MVHVYQADAREMAWHANNSVDLILTDPPYGLSKAKPLSGKTYPGKQGFEDPSSHTYETLSAEWDIIADYRRFTIDWLVQARRVLRPGGSLLICTTSHNDHVIKDLLSLLAMKQVCVITFCKVNAPPSVTRRQPTASTEYILWFSKGKNWTYNYQEAREIGGNKQLRDFWIMPILSNGESLAYRSQKPLGLIERLIRIASNPSDIVLDPFLGTGTTLVAGSKLGRSMSGYETNPEALEIIKKRLTTENIQFQVQ